MMHFPYKDILQLFYKMELPACYIGSNEWDQLACIRDFLFHFESAIRVLSRTNYSAIYVALYYLTKISQIFAENQHNHHLLNIVGPTKTKFVSLFILFWHHDRSMH